MRLHVLVDNNTYIDRYYFGEPAFACLVEDGDKSFLLDTGYSDVCLRNAELMGLDLSALSAIVLSHGHNDHTRGLPLLCDAFPHKRFEVVTHTDTFVPREEEGLSIGSPFSQKDIAQRCALRLSRDPVRLSDKVTFLGEIPRVMPFEAQHPVGQRRTTAGLRPDFVLDDSALACEGPDGLFVVTGCSHAGICNIIEHAKAVTGIKKVCGVLGGFHLFAVDERVRSTLDYFERQHIRQLYPCHCVSFAVKAHIHQRIPVQEVGVGLCVEV